MREAQEEDWDGLIRTIVLNMNLIIMKQPKISWIAFDENERIKAESLLKDNWGETRSVKTQGEYFFDEQLNPMVNYQDVIKPIINAAKRVPNEVTKGRHEFEQKLYVNMLGHFIAIRGFEYEFISESIETTTVVDDGGKVASLLFKTLESEEKMLIFEDEIEKWMFDDDGEVILK
ncbi:hypothetical protein SD71_09690 [Cohnella kolymensis]|uniref:Uncharacterized protein n=1 Tax=Cohnella kolymensis TaxID=1590652 RepID=A0ABR5A587_9BACL|nr:hypothetical protein [Cohnella kolymensis]KIL36209.1 hypothetical protein SD71_09690 [Cohnella kolymensis]